MANDRIWIECKKCKKRKLLIKWWTDRINLFAEQHDLGQFIEFHLMECQERFGEQTLDNDPGFTLETE